MLLFPASAALRVVFVDSEQSGGCFGEEFALKRIARRQQLLGVLFKSLLLEFLEFLLQYVLPVLGSALG